MEIDAMYRMYQIADSELTEALIRYTARIGDVPADEGSCAWMCALMNHVDVLEKTARLFASGDTETINTLRQGAHAKEARRRIAEATALVKLGETTP